MLAKFLSYLGFSLLLTRIVSRWVYGPAWSKLPLRWPLIGMGLVVLGAGIEAVVTLHQLGFGSASDLLDFLSTTRQGKAAIGRILGGVLLLMAEQYATGWWLGPLGMLFAAGGVGAAGHGAEMGFFWGLLDSLHALAAATWVGGLLALGAQKPTANEAQNFSRVAGTCMAILLLTGVLALGRSLPTGVWGHALLHTNWGLLLLGKLALMVLAFLASLVVRARLQATTSRVVQRARRGKGADAPEAQNFLLAETVLMLAILGLSGALSSSALPKHTLSQKVAISLKKQSIPLHLMLNQQALTGRLDITEDGQVTVRFSPPTPDIQGKFFMTRHAMPEQSLLFNCQERRCEALGQLNMHGNWALELSQATDKAKVSFGW